MECQELLQIRWQKYLYWGPELRLTMTKTKFASKNVNKDCIKPLTLKQCALLLSTQAKTHLYIPHLDIHCSFGKCELRSETHRPLHSVSSHFLSRYSWPCMAAMAFLLFKEGKNGFIHWLTWYYFNESFISASYCLKLKQCYLSAFLETDGQNFQTWVDGFILIYSDSTNTGDDFQIAWTALINQMNCHTLTNMWKETFTWEIY